MSPKLSEVKIETVELFIITLTDYLGGCTKPLRSSLTNNKSPSLTTQGSSLWALIVADYDLTIMGKIVAFSF